MIKLSNVFKYLFYLAVIVLIWWVVNLGVKAYHNVIAANKEVAQVAINTAQANESMSRISNQSFDEVLTDVKDFNGNVDAIRDKWLANADKALKDGYPNRPATDPSDARPEPAPSAQPAPRPKPVKVLPQPTAPPTPVEEAVPEKPRDAPPSAAVINTVDRMWGAYCDLLPNAPECLPQTPEHGGVRAIPATHRGSVPGENRP